ncbi:hypothetical protein PGT21_000655 [Puccinia graminis f. sp. tritici]|uniref:Uncharacterized protein n=1 Tax=Puccinia graminis f. sp. tritici TaxID=56615 RepID=A0A5B0N6W1_PUCGR|nr:hypothetical protein PGT21_000655 [Puccinia graminis f. sp. tritici]
MYDESWGPSVVIVKTDGRLELDDCTPQSGFFVKRVDDRICKLYMVSIVCSARLGSRASSRMYVANDERSVQHR